MNKSTQVRDMMVAHASAVLERKMREVLAQRMNEIFEAALKETMDSMQIDIDGQTLEVIIKPRS